MKENEESIISFKGYCYYDSGQYEKAIEQFLEYESITKEKSVAYELIGECYVKLDDNNNALKFFHKALDIEPSNSNICYQLATCYYEFETVLREDSYDLHCRLKLALAYAKMGDDANAERQIQIIDQMSQSSDFSGLPNEKSQQWKNVHGAIQSLKRFLLDHIDDSENKESLS